MTSDDARQKGDFNFYKPRAKHSVWKTFVTILFGIVKRFISVFDTSCNRFEKNEENEEKQQECKQCTFMIIVYGILTH